MDFGTIFNESKKDLTVIYPKESKNGGFTKLDNVRNSIFLAGPCPRSDYRNSDWREKTYDILRNLCFDGYVLNPTNEWYDEGNADELEMQTRWENEAMHKASAIIFYLDRSDKNPGFTSNCEVFQWIKSPRVYFCIPEGCTRNANRYIEIKCRERGITVYRKLEDCYAAAVRDLTTGGRKWFTSDLHFGQERTLTLSRRPFLSVGEMDLEMISNINKRVTMGDELYILGDLGENAGYLDCLNFKTLHFIKGNYERDKLPEVLKDLEKRRDVIIYDNDECTVDVGGYQCMLRHEPLSGGMPEKGCYVLFGHIHGRHTVKKFGIDVGVDAHGYMPMSVEDVEFYLNALDKGFYDREVFCAACS